MGIKKVSTKKIIKLYQSESDGKLNSNILFDVASRLDEIAQTVPTFDQEDYDWGKDAGHFHHAYTKACAGDYPTYLNYKSVEQYLMRSVDTLLAGCHTDVSMADYYIQGGVTLLDAIFDWDGEGSLNVFYQNYNRR
jgi:hypothetical protein